jgi:hypothetical protein
VREVSGHAGRVLSPSDHAERHSSKLAPMVRREDGRPLGAEGSGNLTSCWDGPAGESPVSESAGAPSSRPAAEGEIPTAEAGCQKRVRRQAPRNTEQARGPQLHVKPAASTEKQSEGRAGHVAAKATSTVRRPERIDDLGGVWGAARVQGSSRNTRDPSALPSSRQDDAGRHLPAPDRHTQRGLFAEAADRLPNDERTAEPVAGVPVVGAAVPRRLSPRSDRARSVTRSSGLPGLREDGPLNCMQRV